MMKGDDPAFDLEILAYLHGPVPVGVLPGVQKSLLDLYNDGRIEARKNADGTIQFRHAA